MFYSIIIPTYNSEKSIEACIDSVLNQSFSDFEILIMDGLSSDGTLNILEKYNDSRIVIFSEKDKGIYDAMNKGIKKSKGEWVYFLGSDDKLYSENILMDIASIADKKLDFLYGDAHIVGNAIGWQDGQIYDGEFSLAKILRINICHQAMFYNRNSFKKYGDFNINYKSCADWDYNLRVFAKKRIKYVNQTICFFAAGGYSSVHYEDLSFLNDKWYNIIKYFGTQIFRKEFDGYYCCIVSTKRKLLRRKCFCSYLFIVCLQIKKRLEGFIKK